MLLALSAVLGLLVAIAHSVIGEVQVFKPLRASPYTTGVMSRRKIQILFRALWHFPSGLWAAMGLIALYAAATGFSLAPYLGLMIFIYIISGAINLYANRSIHPGWLFLFANAGVLLAFFFTML